MEIKSKGEFITIRRKVSPVISLPKSHKKIPKGTYKVTYERIADA